MPRVTKYLFARRTNRSRQRQPRLFAGTSGWAYPTWKPGFYPANVPAKKFLEFYASQLNSVEVNYTFRALPTAKMLEGWLAATPASFRFSFKAPQRITHFKRLRECDADVAQFVDCTRTSSAKPASLGLLLFQLPPNFKADPALLAEFLALPALRTNYAPAIAFEFRHESCFTEEIYAILREHNAALCIAESDDLTTPEIHTAATHTCFRLRRNGGYSPPRSPPSPSASPSSPKTATSTSTSSTKTSPAAPSTPPLPRSEHPAQSRARP